jgi:hypothetical protein
MAAAADYAVRARQDPVAFGLLPLNLLLPSLDGTAALERLAARLAAEAVPTPCGECEFARDASPRARATACRGRDAPGGLPQ